MGVGSEVYSAVCGGRRGIGIELKPSYYKQALKNLEAARAGKVDVQAARAVQRQPRMILVFCPMFATVEEALELVRRTRVLSRDPVARRGRLDPREWEKARVTLEDLRRRPDPSPPRDRAGRPRSGAPGHRDPASHPAWVRLLQARPSVELLSGREPDQLEGTRTSAISTPG